MGKILKQGRIVILTSGRHAGKKALVVKSHDQGNKNRKFPNALVLGISRAPRSVYRRLSKSNFLRRTKVKPFVKYINHNHLMPTRYTVTDFQLKDIKEQNLSGQKKSQLLKTWKLQLSEKYRNLPDPKVNQKAGHLRFLYRKLRF